MEVPSVPILLLFLLHVLVGESASVPPSQPPMPVVSANITAYHNICDKKRNGNFEIRDVCLNLSEDVYKTFGDNFGLSYIEDKVLSRVLVNLVAEKCKPGEYCIDEVTDEPSKLIEKVLLNWKDARIREHLCTLRPCLHQLRKDAQCAKAERNDILDAIELFCDLTATSGVHFCSELTVDLVQYAVGDTRRSDNRTASQVCDCITHPTEPCRETCTPLLRKFNCMKDACQHDDFGKALESYEPFKWFFARPQELLAKYNVTTFCPRPAPPKSVDRGTVVYAFIEVGNTKIIVAIVVSIVCILCGMLGVTCLCWRRIFVNSYSRSRVDYMEVKGET